MTEDGGLDRGGSVEVVRKWLGSDYIPKVETTPFPIGRIKQDNAGEALITEPACS